MKFKVSLSNFQIDAIASVTADKVLKTIESERKERIMYEKILYENKIKDLKAEVQKRDNFLKQKESLISSYLEMLKRYKCEFENKDYYEKGDSKMEQWTYELNIKSDIWNGAIFDSREEAIEEANLEAISCDVDMFKVGVVKKIATIGVDAEFVLERIREEVYSDAGEVAEDYLCCVSKEQEKELENELNKVFSKWKEKHGYSQNFYNVVGEEIIKVK